jgi:hypothetical protein
VFEGKTPILSELVFSPLINSMKKQTHLAFLGHHALKKRPALTAFGGPLPKLAS